MGWHTDGEGKRGSGNVLLSVVPSRHGKTGARNMREHRVAKRTQAEERNARTPENRRRAWRREQLKTLEAAIGGRS